MRGIDISIISSIISTVDIVTQFFGGMFESPLERIADMMHRIHPEPVVYQETGVLADFLKTLQKQEVKAV